ncbi:hypothetical protein ACHAW6_000495 [Cyclotella cf. meneghiniana]
MAHRIGSDICYCLALANGSVIAETTVQHVTRDELHDPDIAQRVETFNRHMTECLNDTIFTNPEAEGLPQSEDEDDINIDTYNKLIGAQVLLDDGMKATFKRQLTIFDGTLIGQAHKNPLLDTRQYEVELEDGTTDAYFANTQKARNYWLLRRFVTTGRMQGQFQYKMVTTFHAMATEHTKEDHGRMGALSRMA